MIFPDICLEEWCRRYPSLEIYINNCPHCGKELVANRPFIEKNWVGLRSDDCMCGKGKAVAISVPRFGHHQSHSSLSR